MPTTTPSEYDHEYYFTHDGKIDLAKIREECEKRVQGDYYNDPATSLIHFHKFATDCDRDTQDHEEYRP